jgi:hypothetical protein
MPLMKLVFKPGINREVTQLSDQGGWFDGSNVRFRSGFPEKIGGWARRSPSTFLGICRSLMNWVTNGGANLMGVGTHLKFYIEFQGILYDITPVRLTATLTDPFDTTSGSAVVLVTHTAHGALINDYVTFADATAVGGLTISGEYQITRFIDANSYEITAASAATSTANGGGTVSAQYQINTGFDISRTATGWGGGYWGGGTWGTGVSSQKKIRLWSQTNFGEDLILGPRGEPLYYWDVNSGFSSRAVALSTLSGASDVPVAQNTTMVSDVSRFVMCFGVNELGTTELDPMLIRWSDQEDAANWTPAVTNQAGGLRLSLGSEIVTAKQMRQEILVFTDVALYSLQYQGPPFVWGAQLLGSDTTVISPNCVATAANIAFWMGEGSFYIYNGSISPLPCSLKRYVFNDLNRNEVNQVFAGTNEQYTEVWWFYPSANSTTPNRLVIYNYVEQTWYKGDITRYAWCDQTAREYPTAAGADLLIEHERGIDDNSGATPVAIPAYIESGELDIQQGQNLALVTRIVPDITFRGSTATTPSATLTMYPMQYPGTGYGDSVAGSRTKAVTKVVSASSPEQFTPQLFVRVRGRQMVLRVESNTAGVAWQLGSPMVDLRPDGKR